MQNLITEFKNSGLMADNPILDGTIKRCGTESNPKGKNGWYIGWTKFVGGKDIICCSMGDWTQSDKPLFTYKSWKDDNDFSQADRDAIAKHQSELQQKAEAEKTKRHKEAAKKAQSECLRLSEAGISQYLDDKGVQAHGVRFGSDAKDGNYIAIPLRNYDRDIKSLQRIYDVKPTWANDRKYFLSGGEKKGLFHLIGEVSPIQPVCFAEGYATAASIHEATGYPAVVCFDAGNLEQVVKVWRENNPTQIFIICADNDQWKPEIGNAGIKKATAAAKEHGCYLWIPDFTGISLKKDWMVHRLGFMCFSELKLSDIKPTDANDFHKLAGLEHLKKSITQNLDSSYLKTPVTAVTEFTDCSGAGAVIASETVQDDIRGGYPSPDMRPCFRVYEDFTKISRNNTLKAGVYYHFIAIDKEGNQEIVDSWICSPLYVEAVTLDQHSNNYGRYLKFKSTRGIWRQWCMPMSMLKGSGDDLRGELLSMGVTFNVQDRKSLIRYLTSEIPKETLEIATQTGWHKEAFVLPEQCIGSDKYFYQSDYFNVDSPYRQKSTLEQWQQQIARYCVNNALLILAVCLAFAGALLRKAHQQGGGVHTFGDSSKGKTTILVVSCSVFGDETYKRSWKATSNGMEATAALFNDSLLALDEISECDPKEIGIIVYALANGVGKQRANRNGGSRAAYQWKVMVLSNGERSIDCAMSEAGKQIKAGQEVRLLNIPIFGKYGAFDCLHDKKDGRDLSDHLQTAATKYYGVAGIEYLTKLVTETRNIDQLATDYTEALINGESLSSQELRAAKRFGLLALAGELATEYGITGWQVGDAVNGIVECFARWRESFGGGDIEEQQVLSSVKDFIDRFGDSRFSDVTQTESIKINDRAGYWLDETEGRVYLFNDAGMKEALEKNGLKRGLEVLKKQGWLMTDNDRNKKQYRVHAGSRERFYCIKKTEAA